MEFKEFNKIPRLSRECIITEKIDGTNAQIYIPEDEEILEIGQESLSGDFLIFAGSRTRWITTKNDNMGFANWVKQNANELIKLGPGRHYGEWWGIKIQRGYNLKEKRFSLFNTSRWNSGWNLGNDVFGDNLCLEVPICDVVPIISKGNFDSGLAKYAIDLLKEKGSFASPKFMNPEGIVIYHVAGNLYFKKTIKNDESPKGLVK